MHYIICSCARSGSTLLSETLAAVGAGRPEEYLSLRVHNGNVTEIVKRADFMRPTPLAYIERIKQENSVGNIFGLKTHYSQLAKFPDIMENLTTIFPDAKYISITRRNILRQAISASRAAQTRAWTSKLQELVKPRFNIFGIVKHFILTALEIEMWERFYKKNSIKPLRILYEDLDEDYTNTMIRVLSFLEIQADVPAPPTKKQADIITDLWVLRFINLLDADRSFNRVLRLFVRRF